MPPKGRPGVPIAALVLLALSGLFSGWDAAPTLASPGGLVNPGFEDGVLNGSPSGWTVVQPVPDAVKVVGTEGPSQFPAYADMGNVTVAPFKGTLMLRLGSPKRLAESQNRNPNLVRQ